MNDPIASSSIPRAAMQAVDDQEIADAKTAQEETKPTPVMAKLQTITNVNRQQRELAKTQIVAAEAEKATTLTLAEEIHTATIADAERQFLKDKTEAVREYEATIKDPLIVIEATTEFLKKVNENAD